MAKTAKATKDMAKEGSREAGSQNQPPQDSPARGGQAPQADSKKQVQSVEFAEAVGTETADSPGKTSTSSVESLDMILDMNVPITVAIGRTEMPVRQLLQLGPGSVLKLNKPIDAPADLFLKDAKFAEGDVVVVDERFAIRIKQIICANRESP